MKKHWLLILILLFGLFFRTYRTSNLMGFYFDQGRDAKVIWDLWHNNKFFLIGPTTGIEGIFLGPFYYYLIAPAYLLGGGNPVWPAVELVIINILGIFVVYKIGEIYFSRTSGIIAAFLLAFSHRLVQDHRWLSNPTPLPLLAAIAVFIILKIINSQARAIHYLILGLVLGLSLQLEAASAIFFLPATALIFILFYRSIFRKLIYLLHLVLTFSLTLIPQLYFNFRHENIIFQAFQRFLISEKSFQPTLSGFYTDRLRYYYQVFFEKLINDNNLLPLFILLIIFLLLFTITKLVNKNIGVLLVWIITPLVFLLFYHGNYGFIWGYYFTGVIPVFILLFSYILSLGIAQKGFACAVVVVLLLLFSYDNTLHLKKFLTTDLKDPTTISFDNSLSAVDWVYQDAKNTPFNVDAYVPPVIPHAYNYLFLWRGSTKYHVLPQQILVPRLYTVIEQDPPHPERLEQWLTRQQNYAQVGTEITFGGVSAQRRARYQTK